MGNLSYVSGNLSEIADDLRAKLNSVLRAVESIPASNVVPSTEEARPSPVSAAYVRRLIAERRQRDKYFPENLFADPAWDMLLELYEASLEQQRLSITNLCEGAAVPPTTALRWIGVLEAKGLTVRRKDPLDARRIFISLSGTGQSAMEAYFRGQMPRNSRNISAADTPIAAFR